jgi:pSer/pThr/pTyr-binding forkhead associated (FHA) protein
VLAQLYMCMLPPVLSVGGGRHPPRWCSEARACAQRVRLPGLIRHQEEPSTTVSWVAADGFAGRHSIDMTSRCFCCQQALRVRELLCASCLDRLIDGELCAEQISSREGDGLPSAWLIDGFGRPHDVPAATTPVGVGRHPSNQLQVACATVSLHHAQLQWRPRSKTWFIRDLGADNGVWVNDDRLAAAPFPLELGDRIRLGRRVGFRFVPLDSDEIRERAQQWCNQDVDSLEENTLAEEVHDDDTTPLLLAAASDGGAVIRVGAMRVTLSELEYELLLVLHQHHTEDAGRDLSVRGYVAAAELLTQLSFHSDTPDHANLRGVVRKLRRKFAENFQRLDVIESTQGLGYRLVKPMVVK